MTSTHLGGRYTARENADGTLDLFDVPIVSELQKGERKDLPEFEITPEWLTAALNRAESRRTGGYLPPLHVHHHDDDKSPSPRAGFFSPKRIGDLEMDGKTVKTLFADLLCIPKPLAAKIKAGELPYRSIEILNVNADPEIDSLALLDSQPPQFRYPLLSIGKLVHAADAPMTSLAANRTAAVAFASFPGTPAAKALFNFGGSDMADVDEDEKLKAEADAKKAEEEKLKAAAGEQEPAWLGGLVEKLTAAMSASLDAYHAKYHGQAATPPAHPEPDGDEGVPLAAGGDDGKPKFVDPTLEQSLVAKAIKAVESKFAGSLAESKGEIVGLKAALAQRDKKDAEKEKLTATAELIRTAKIELRAYSVDPDILEKDLPEYAKLGKEHLDRFVAGIKKLAPKDPSETIDGFRAEAREDDAPEVARFAAKGPEALATARSVEKHYTELKARGALPRHMTLERYLACNQPMFEAAGVRA